MQYTVPHYYRQFECIADKCPDTCCAGWQIVIDRKSLKKYRRTKGALGSRLHNEVDWKEGVFRQYKGRCAFLNDENLCDLYLEGGKEMGCRTCRTYPRHIEEFEGLKEISLSMSCPAAAHIILGCKEKVRFLTKEVCLAREEVYEEFDYFLFTKLMDARELVFHILQDRNIKIKIRMAMVLAFAHDFQQRIEKSALFDAEPLIERYRGKDAARWFGHKLDILEEDAESEQKRYGVLERAFGVFYGMEILQSDWRDYLGYIKEVLFGSANTAYKAECRLPKEWRKEYEIVWEQLLIYFVQTYFCGAVYDGDAYGKMKFALLGTLLVREMAKVTWWKDRKEASEDESCLFMEKAKEAARRYAKEIEHSDLNKKFLEEQLNDEERFGLEAFFRIL